MTEESKTESVATEPVVNEPIVEPTPVRPESETITSLAPEPTPEPAVVSETPTAQRVEPLSPGPAQDPETAPEPPSAPIDEPVSIPEPQPIPEPIPAPQAQTSTPLVIQTSLAQELLIKAREVVQFRKRKKLEKIMSMFLKKASISNDEVEKLLHVSDATATRYLEQLEKEGKIQQTGVGKAISYSRA